ncbi:MAG: alpha/beta hydrolase [Oscillospiraceae bacterium]|nr:alpha/beta hydrolase [Oscillospiraceae bacterium]
MIWNAKNGKVQIGDTEMSYASFGSGNKVLILLPGLSDGLVTVDGKALILAAPYRLFFKDYTVYMFSRKNNMPDNYSIREMADDHAAAIRKLGIQKASVLGVSQGGMIAQYLAVNHADLTEKLVIAVSAPNANDTLRPVIEAWIELAKQGNYKQLMIDTAEKSYSEAYLKKYQKMYPFIGLIGKPKSFHRFLVNANAILHFDCSDALEKITCPTLIIGGETDQIVGPLASYQMHEKIKGSEIYMYKEFGHAAYEEAADFYRRVFDFLVQ